MRRTRRNRVSGFFSGTILVALFTLLFFIQMPAAHASENMFGVDINVVATDGDDVSILAGDVHVDARDAGEISIVGGDVTVEGTVRNDVSIAGGDVDVTADVGGEVSIAGGDVRFEGDVTGEVNMAGGEVRFTGTSGDMNLAGGEVTLDGTVNGTLRVGAEHFTVTPGTVIHGDFEFKGPNEPVLPEGLTIMGAYTYEYSDLEHVFDGDIPTFLFPMVAIAGVMGVFALFASIAFMALVGAGVLMLMMTGLTARTIDGIRQRPISSIGMGVVVLASLIVMAMLLCITVIGIPLAFAIMLFYPVLILIGFIVAILGVPYLVLRKSPRDVGAGAKIAFFFLSLIVLAVLFSLPLVGQILFALVVLMGVGAFGAAVLGGRSEGASAV